MPRYLISFDDGAMDHVTDEELPAVGDAARGVVRDLKAAGAWVFGGGVLRQQATVVGTDGTVTAGPVPETKAVIGGFSVVEVDSHDEAVAWAARIADACRCPQEVREIGDDPESLAPDLRSAVAEALSVREQLAAFERRTYGREWTLSDLVAGLATDVGDLARLVAAKQGLRPAPDDLDAALAHEVADCLWALFVVADKVGVDVPTAYADGMGSLRRWLADL